MVVLLNVQVLAAQVAKAGWSGQILALHALAGHQVAAVYLLDHLAAHRAGLVALPLDQFLIGPIYTPFLRVCFY